MSAERAQYTERTPWGGWVRALLWGAVTVVAYPMLAGWDTDLEFPIRALIAAGFVGFGVLVQVVFEGTLVRVFDDRVQVSLGSVALVRTAVRRDEIEGVTSVHYRPLAEFGGWGVRGNKRRRAWTARGDQAVVLTLTDGRVLYIGSDHPRRLEERIRTILIVGRD